MKLLASATAVVLGTWFGLLGCSDSGDPTGSGGGSGAASSGGSGAGAASSGGSGAGATASGGVVGAGASPATGGSGGGTGGLPATGGTGGSGGSTGPTFVYVGSGTWGSSNGHITVYELNRGGKTLDFVSEHDAGGLASYLAIAPDRSTLFSADENDGGVIGFSIDPATGSLGAGQVRSHSNHPVHLSFSPDGAYLLGANYAEGNVDVYPVTGAAAGAPVTTTATGVNAHSVVVNAANQVLVANKGSSTIHRYTLTAGALTPADPVSTPYDGARHLFFGPDGRAYVISETADQMSALVLEDNGALSSPWTVTRLPSDANGSPGADTGSDIRVTPSGRFLYATNRGSSNTIVAYDISSGTPAYLEHESTRGETPRSFTIDPEEQFVIVANRAGNSLVLFEIQSDGSLEHAGTVAVDSPFFVGAWHL